MIMICDEIGAVRCPSCFEFVFYDFYIDATDGTTFFDCEDCFEWGMALEGQDDADD